ncbi:MAG: hypothetical protein ACJA1H_000065 [Glaciecola sp.]|jgi:hypothetical protein
MCKNDKVVFNISHLGTSFDKYLTNLKINFKMKNLLLFITIITFSFNSNAQEKDKFRFGIDLGYVFANGGGGLLFDLEPKFNITDNSNVGLRIGVASSVADIEDSINFDINGNILGTYDHYFGSNKSIVPFLGGGLGVFILGGSDDINDDGFAGTQIGGMVRGGIELSKFRIALEYNIIPKSDLVIGQSVKNSYFGASIGFYIGGGKWKR